MVVWIAWMRLKLKSKVELNWWTLHVYSFASITECFLILWMYSISTLYPFRQSIRCVGGNGCGHSAIISFNDWYQISRIRTWRPHKEHKKHPKGHQFLMFRFCTQIVPPIAFIEIYRKVQMYSVVTYTIGEFVTYCKWN